MASPASIEYPSIGLGVAVASVSPLIESRLAGPVVRRRVHPLHRTETVEPSLVRRRRKHPSAALFHFAALLDSTPLANESNDQHASDVGCVDAGCNRGDLPFMASRGKGAVSGEVSRAVGAFAMPTAICA